jgi:hypothetical protein
MAGGFAKEQWAIGKAVGRLLFRGSWADVVCLIFGCDFADGV